MAFKSNILKTTVVLVLLGSLNMTVCAQTSTMDLRQVYQAALEQDSSIRASRASADAGRERLPQARAGLLPQVSASAGRNNNNLNSTSPNLLGNPVTTNDKYFSDSRTIQLRQPLMNESPLRTNHLPALSPWILPLRLCCLRF